MRSARFQRHHRLLTQTDYSRVFKNAERSRDRYFTVLSARSDLADARLGLAVSRKTDKRVVVRNRIKRLVRESFRRRHLRIADYVVISQPAAAAESPAVLRRSLSAHWRKLSGAEASQQDNHDG